MKETKYRAALYREASSSLMWLLPLALGVAALAVSTWIASPSVRSQVQLSGLGFMLLTPFVFLLNRAHPRLGTGLSLVVMAAAVVFTVVWQDIPAVLPLLALPSGLFAALVGIPAACVLASAETLLLFGLPGIASIDLFVSISMIWGAVGLVVFIHRPVIDTANWASQFYEQALNMREESFFRRETLEQTMQDLAHANRQLAATSKRMASLRTIAEDAQETKTMFLAKVSHEFRTPLNMIIGLVELMVDSPEIYTMAFPPEMAEDLKVVLQNCHHLSSMVNDVLDLTRTEAGQVTLHRESVDLADIVDEAATSVRPLIEKKGLYFAIDTPPTLPKIFCDRARIRQVILNLVSNAARFTEEGGITIDVKVHDGQVVTRVADTGPGIAEEDISRIFEPFSQGRGDIWRDKGGSGLGLVISKQFVNLHGGHLWVESEVGEGSSFNFRLPVEQPVAPIAPPGRFINEEWIWHETTFHTERAGVADQLRKPLLLLYDDAGSLSAKLMHYAEDADIVRVDDPSLVTQAAAKYRPDILLVNSCDSQEVGDLAAFIDEELPVGTLMVQSAVPPTAALAEVAGAAGHLVKPITREMLADAINNLGTRCEKVLIVDDNPDVLRLFSRMLRVYDPALRVDVADTPEAALTMVRSGGYDLVLLDMLMPRVSGSEWIAAAKSEGTLANLPVILISAQDRADRPAKANHFRVSVAGGITIAKLLDTSLELSRLVTAPSAMSGPDAGPDPGP